MKASHQGRNVQAQFQPDFSMPCSLRLWHLQKHHPALTETHSSANSLCLGQGSLGPSWTITCKVSQYWRSLLEHGKGVTYGCMGESNAAALKSPCQCRQWLEKAASLELPCSTCSQLCMRAPSSPSNCHKNLWISYLSQLLKLSKSSYLIRLV